MCLEAKPCVLGTAGKLADGRALKPRANDDFTGESNGQRHSLEINMAEGQLSSEQPWPWRCSRVGEIALDPS